MIIDEKQICRDFREAKHKGMQVGILAELNLVSKDRIFEILITNGEDVRGINGSRAKNLEKMEEILDGIDARIKELERKYLNVAKSMAVYEKGGA